MALFALDKRAESARVALYERYDKLNALWLKAEEHLSRYHVLRPVWYEYAQARGSNDDPYGGDNLVLYYVKDRWRICYKFSHYILPDDETPPKPITDCSVVIRKEAAKHLPALHTAIVMDIEGYVGETDEAIKALEEFNYRFEIGDLLAERHTLNGKK